MIRRHPILFSIVLAGLFVGFLSTVFFCIYFFFSDSDSRPFNGDQVAIVPIIGAIFDSSDTLKKLEHLRKDDLVKAIVLRIDSPGGAVAPSQEIFEEVKKIKSEKKIVVVSMGTLAASGGYYIAVAANKILANPGTITGSIGVIMEDFDLQGLLKWAHLDSRVLKSGKFKDVGSPFRSMTAEEKTFLQNVLDNMYNQFKQAVSIERAIPLAKIDSLAEGKIYTGEQALQLGLIDGIGNLYDAIDEAKKLAKLPEDTHVTWPKEKSSPLDFLTGSASSDDLLQTLSKKYLSNVRLPVWIFSTQEVSF